MPLEQSVLFYPHPICSLHMSFLSFYPKQPPLIRRTVFASLRRFPRPSSFVIQCPFLFPSLPLCPCVSIFTSIQSNHLLHLKQFLLLYPRLPVHSAFCTCSEPLLAVFVHTCPRMSISAFPRSSPFFFALRAVYYSFLVNYCNVVRILV